MSIPYSFLLSSLGSLFCMSFYLGHRMRLILGSFFSFYRKALDRLRGLQIISGFPREAFEAIQGSIREDNDI